MAAATVAELSKLIAQLRENPSTLFESSKGRDLDDLGVAMGRVRQALIAAVVDASDDAFRPQAPTEAGEEVWSIGEIVGHCNGAILNIGGLALTAMEIEPGDPPAALLAASEVRVMSREEAVATAKVVNPDDFYAMIPADAALDNEMTHDFFGTIDARTLLHFMAMHEAEHVAQITALG